MTKRYKNNLMAPHARSLEQVRAFVLVIPADNSETLVFLLRVIYERLFPLAQSTGGEVPTKTKTPPAQEPSLPVLHSLQIATCA